MLAMTALAEFFGPTFLFRQLVLRLRPMLDRAGLGLVALQVE
jgi:hypothetical protein